MARLSPGVRGVLRRLLAYGPDRVVLFGSAARGDADLHSDLDLVIIKETRKRFVERLVEVSSFLPDSKRVDALVYTPEEWEGMVRGGSPFARRVMKEGKVLYEKPQRGRPVARSGRA